ncbi:MAG: NmrA family NAD(P)-binding protein [Myxococcales bacterium]|nr:NmrA family NAD(P)-binding protein [Myxococcales bacterium]
MTILIATPNGNIGRPLASQLLDAGASLVLIARDPAKVADLQARGARVVQGSLDDPATLARAFEGVSDAFWLTPPTFRPDYRQWALDTAAAAAAEAKKSGARVVVLSSVGAHQAGNGPVSVVGEVEGVLRAALPDVLALRPAYFFENFLRDAATIAAQGAWYGPTPAGRAMPMVATKDIAAVAAEELRAAWRGHRIRGVHGPADLTMAEVAEAFSEALGREVRYVEVPLSAALEAMAGAGAPDFVVALYAELLDGFVTGRTDPAEPRTRETTTPTTIAEFARDVLRPALAR